MIVHDLHILGRLTPPYEADPPLVIDANAVLASTVPLQGLKTIAGRSGQVANLLRVVQLPKLTLDDPLNVVRQLLREPSVEQGFGIPVGE